MNGLKTLEKILKLRTLSKRVQTLSYTLSKTETRLNIDSAPESDYENIISIYTTLLGDINEIQEEYTRLTQK